MAAQVGIGVDETQKKETIQDLSNIIQNPTQSNPTPDDIADMPIMQEMKSSGPSNINLDDMVENLEAADAHLDDHVSEEDKRPESEDEGSNRQQNLERPNLELSDRMGVTPSMNNPSQSSDVEVEL